MMATSNQELDSFLAKFKYLCSAGYKASVSFKSENFCTRISLDVDLPFLAPPWSLPPPACVLTPKMSSTSERRRSPSYYRRLKRRRDERLKENSDATDDLDKNVTDAAMLQTVDEYTASDYQENVKECDERAAMFQTVDEHSAEDVHHEENVKVCDDRAAMFQEDIAGTVNEVVTKALNVNNKDEISCIGDGDKTVQIEEIVALKEDAGLLHSRPNARTDGRCPNEGCNKPVARVFTDDTVSSYEKPSTSRVEHCHYPLPKLEFLKF